MHAFLVLAYEEAQLTSLLASRLADVGAVHLHVDARSSVNFSDTLRFARPLPQRLPVHWGGWNMVRASLLLARQAFADPEVDQVTLLSGRHYPVLSPRSLVAQPPADRIRLQPAPDIDMDKPEWRFRHRYVSWFSPQSRRSVAINGVLRRLTWYDYQKVLAGRQLYAGAAWWSLTRPTLEAAMRLLSQDHALRRYLRSIVCPDESAINTLVGAVLDSRAAAGETHLYAPWINRETTYVEWAGQHRHPEPLTAASIRRAREQGWWFARKFTLADVEEAEAHWSHPMSGMGS